MSGVVRDWRVELVEAYADLFHPVGNPPAAQGAPDCGAGWRDLLQRCCVRIRAAVQADDGSFKFSQIKEKYGTARIYWNGALSPEATAQVEEAIDLGEARSACTCETCGEPGRLRAGGWLTTRCTLHAEGRPAIEHRSGLENVHLVRHFVGGRRFVTCRRYDRYHSLIVELDDSCSPKLAVPAAPRRTRPWRLPIASIQPMAYSFTSNLF